MSKKNLSMSYLRTNEELQNRKLCIWQLTQKKKKNLYQNNNDNNNNIFYSILPYVSSFPKMSLFHQLFLQNVMKSCMLTY
jgi:hypothetical protein